jgi:hypothetical protein
MYYFLRINESEQNVEVNKVLNLIYYVGKSDG